MNENLLLNCSSCGEDLVEIIVNSPSDTEWLIKAECPHCHDSSFVKRVKGHLSFKDTEKVEYVDWPTENGVIILKTQLR